MELQEKRRFKDWYIQESKGSPNTADTYCSLICKAESDYRVDAATEYFENRCVALLNMLDLDMPYFPRLRDTKSAVNKYVVFKDSELPPWTKPGSMIMCDGSVAQEIAQAPQLPTDSRRTRPQSYLPPVTWPTGRRVVYADNVEEDEKIEWLIPLVEKQIRKVNESNIYTAVCTLVDEQWKWINPFELFFTIQIVLRKERPVEEYPLTEDEQAERIMRIDDPDPVRKKAAILDILRYRSWAMPIGGRYCPAGHEPFDANQKCTSHIEIFYNNLYSSDTDVFKAAVAETLAHELFHFWHDCYCPPTFRTRSSKRKDVVEGTADFFSVMFILEDNDILDRDSRIEVARESYAGWEDNRFMSWPYSNALFFCAPFDDFDDFQKRFDQFKADRSTKNLSDQVGHVKKLLTVLRLGREDMDMAYREMKR